METPTNDDDVGVEKEGEEENKFLYCSGKVTEEERNYLIGIGQIVEKDGEFVDVST